MEKGIDLNEQLVTNKPSTFFFRMNGDSMKNIGISSGDILVVDRSITNVNGKVCVCIVDGEMLVRIVDISFDGKKVLSSANEAVRNTILSPFDEFSIWGVVTYSIHSHK